MTVPEAASSAVAAGSVWLPALSPAIGVIVGGLLGGLLTGTFTLKATAKQQKAQLRREFILMRQKWIENMRELIPEIIKTAGWFYLSKISPSSDGEARNAETTSQTLKLAQQIIQVELMLDPEDKAHVSLIQAMHVVRTCAFANGSQLSEFEQAVYILRDRCVVVLRNSSGSFYSL